jgi:hypothetical protein
MRTRDAISTLFPSGSLPYGEMIVLVRPTLVSLVVAGPAHNIRIRTYIRSTAVCDGTSPGTSTRYRRLPVPDLRSMLLWAGPRASTCIQRPPTLPDSDDRGEADGSAAPTTARGERCGLCIDPGITTMAGPSCTWPIPGAIKKPTTLGEWYVYTAMYAGEFRFQEETSVGICRGSPKWPPKWPRRQLVSSLYPLCSHLNPFLPQNWLIL